MKRMPRLVQHRVHITMHADRVHEDERQTRFVERRLITSGRFPFAIRKVQQARLLHLAKSGGETPVEQIENVLCLADHVLDFFEWPQWLAVQRIHGEVPWPELLDPKLL